MDLTLRASAPAKYSARNLAFLLAAQRSIQELRGADTDTMSADRRTARQSVDMQPRIAKSWAWASVRVRSDPQAAEVCIAFFRSLIMQLPGRSVEEQLAWCEVAGDAAAAVGDEDARIVVLGVKARLLLFRPGNGDALPLFEEFHEAARRTRRVSEVDLALEDGRMGLLYLEQRQVERATKLLQQALAVLERDRRSPRSLHWQNLRFFRSPYQDAERAGDRYLDIATTSLSADHPVLVPALLARAMCYLGSAQASKAETMLRKARTLCVYQHESMTATITDLLGMVLQNQGQLEESRPLLEEGLRLRELWLGTSHLDTALSTAHLASLCFEQGDYRGAQQLWARTARITSHTEGTVRSLHASALRELGMVYMKRKKYDKAASTLDRALAEAIKVHGADDISVAKFLAARAEACYIPGAPQLREAEKLLELAIEVRRLHRGPLDPKRMAYSNQLRIVRALRNGQAKGGAKG